MKIAVVSHVRRLLVAVNVVPCSLTLVTLTMETPFSSESVLTIAARRNIPEDGILKLTIVTTV
jgi:hypothetical protein